MRDFEHAFTIVLRAEGGYSDDRDDPGGETNLGVTASVWAAWCVARGLARKPMRDLLAEDVWPLYRERYWMLARCGEMAWPLSLIHFDAAVNCGVVRAAKLLQRALGVKVDGVLGPITMAHTIPAGPRAHYRYLLERTFFYLHLDDQYRERLKFFNAWFGRLEPLYAEVA